MNPSLALASFLAALSIGACTLGSAVEGPGALLPASFEKSLVARGADLAAIGNCASCHTESGGRPYAGGRPTPTPYGVVYGTNLTPDVQTGIGAWTETDFRRAMREGVSKDGRHLFPAFPYDHFTRLANDDVRALYAFLMTREAAYARTPQDTVPLPRALLPVWKALFLDRGAFEPDPARTREWNRGAYLVEALAHCGACHTPRNFLGAEKKGRRFAGGEAAGWHAPSLGADSPAPVPWTPESMAVYLRTGIAEAHAMTAGPMAEVVRNLAAVNEEDIRAMALYVTSTDTRTGAEREAKAAAARAAAGRELRGKYPDGKAVLRGAEVYAGACADCHDRGRAAEGGALELPLASGLTLPTPRNLIHIVRDGIVPPPGEAAPWMPDYAAMLTEGQLADLVTYLRALTTEPEWKDVEAQVAAAARGAP